MIKEIASGDLPLARLQHAKATEERKVSTEEAPPPFRRDSIQINFYPQDPIASELEKVTIPGEGVEAGPANERFAVKDRAISRRDDDGNMLYEPSDPHFDGVQAFAVSTMMAALLEKYLGRTIPWAFGSNHLEIHPHAGKDINANYDRFSGSLNFFWWDDPIAGKRVQSSQSLEVEGHETDHALLDGAKPGYHSFMLDAAGYHEAFGDMGAMCLAMQNDQVAEKFLEQTGGDFRKQNLVARLAEELGAAANHERAKPKKDHDYIRNAINDLKWSDPEKLPWDPGDESKLGREPHNYSRLFTGAFYDILSGVYHKFVDQGVSPHEAVKKTGQAGASLLARSLDFAPESLDTYRQMAQAYLKADQMDHQGAYAEILKKVFLDRGILTEGDIEAALESPSIQLKQKFSNYQPDALEEAQAFLTDSQVALGVTGIPFKAEKVVTNNRGETHVIYGYDKEIELNGTQFRMFDGSVVDLHGDLTLTFNKRGRLISMTVNPVTPEAEEMAKKDIEQIINARLVKYIEPWGFHKVRFPEDLWKSNREPFFAYTQFTEGKTKLVRAPIYI